METLAQALVVVGIFLMTVSGSFYITGIGMPPISAERDKRSRRAPFAYRFLFALGLIMFIMGLVVTGMNWGNEMAEYSLNQDR